MSRKDLLIIAGMQVLLLLTGFVGYELWHGHSGPEPGPAPDVKTEGRAYGLDQLRAYAAGCRKVAADVRAGKPLGKAGDDPGAIARFHDDLAAADREAFERRFAPALRAVIPEGEEPKTDDQRRRLAAFYEDVATGVEQIRGVK